MPTAGIVPISASQDSPGPIGRQVSDVARLFAVLADVDPVDLDGPSPRLVAATTWRTGHPPTDRAGRRSRRGLRAAGEPVVDREVAVPGPEVVNDEFAVLLAELVDDLGDYLDARPGEGVHSLAEVVAYERDHADVELPWFGHELFVQALGTGGRAGEAYAGARSRNRAWAVETCLGPALDGADVLVAAAYGPAWKSDLVVGGHAGTVSSWITTPAAIAGWPIISVPVGLVHGLPVGLAMIARPGEEWTLLAAASRVEAVVAATAPLPRPGVAGARPGLSPSGQPLGRRAGGCGGSPPCRPGCGPTRSPTPVTSRPRKVTSAPRSSSHVSVTTQPDGVGLEPVGPAGRPSGPAASPGRRGPAPGTASTTIPAVDHRFRPAEFTPLNRAPGAAPVAPPSQEAPSFSGDHSPILGRSATIA